MANQWGKGKAYGKANASKGLSKKPMVPTKATAKPTAMSGPTTGLKTVARGHLPPLAPTKTLASSTVLVQALATEKLEPAKPETFEQKNTITDGKGFNFLGLPGELRNKVYHHMIPRQNFKIEWLTRGKTLTYSLPHDKKWKRTIQLTATRERQEMNLQKRLRSNPVPMLHIPAGPAALLQVCRQMYLDTCGLFYSSSTFEISGVAVLRKFISSLTPEAKASVRTLFLRHGTYGDPRLTEFLQFKDVHDDRWKDICQTVAIELINLEDFQIHLQINDLPLRLNLEAEWAQPLLAFRGRNLKTVKVDLRYPRGYYDKRLESCAGIVRRELLGAEYREEIKEKKKSSVEKEVLPKAIKCLNIT